MAITSAICNSFKNEVLTATHNFTASTGNTFKLALYTSSATLSASTTAYSTSNEITNSSGSAYNDTATGDPAVCAVAFGGDKTVSSGTFTIQFPAKAATTAIVRIA